MNHTKPTDPVHPVPKQQVVAGGLTKREYFAAQAMGGILSNDDVYALHESPEHAMRAAVDHADALISELNQDD